MGCHLRLQKKKSTNDVAVSNTIDLHEKGEDTVYLHVCWEAIE